MRVLARSALLVFTLTVAVASPSADAAVSPIAEGTIITVAGTGVDGHAGDGGPAVAATIDHPRGLAVLQDGALLFAEPFAPTVRKVGTDGRITTVAGTDVAGFAGDGGPAVLAQLDLAHGVAPMPEGGFVIADTGNNRIRRVAGDGTISTVAGTGVRGFGGDGQAATSAALTAPRGIVSLADGTLLIPDSGNNRIRQVSPAGIITTVAGSGEPGFSGDGGPATAAQLDRPFGVAPMPDGGFLIVDILNARIRRVWPDRTITTVAGTGVPGFSGDGGPATQAQIDGPSNVTALPDGGFLIADTENNRIRRVWPDGTITTVAGTGAAGYSGDSGPAIDAQLNAPKAVLVAPDERGFWIGDSANNRVRFVRLDLRVPLKLRLLRATLRGRRGTPVQLRYSLSGPARVRLDVRLRSRTVLKRRASGRPGVNSLEFGARLKAGVYALTIIAIADDGRDASATGRLIVRR